MKNFDLVIGIDQTGAVEKGGKPKSLPVVVFKKTSQTWSVARDENGFALSLPSFSRKDFNTLIKKLTDNSLDRHSVLILVDTVFGLPRELVGIGERIEFRRAMRRAKTHQGFGMKAAKSFFEMLREDYEYSSKGLPRRNVEKKLGANSLFQTHPFQRNIQTGSYRIWKELAQWSETSYQLWPFEKVEPCDGKPVICEAYPSHAWKVLNNSARTSLDFSVLRSKIGNLMEVPGDLVDVSHDHRDAFFIAALAVYMLETKSLQNSDVNCLEGDILGSHLSAAG